MTRILIADDHPIVRKGLKDVFAEEFAASVIGEAQNAQEVVEQVRKQKWDILILDISMPGKSGLELIKELKQECPKLPILVLTMHSEEQLAMRVLKAGAVGYVTKDNPTEELIQAIKLILAGGRYVHPSLAQALTFDFAADSGKAPHAELSDREYQVMCMIASGKTVRQIARELSLSIKTINTYRSRVLEKLKMRTNVELTRYALENKLVG
jgi:DNA-binding NarL/FixJ family response regulator